MSLPHGKLEVLKVCMVIIRAIHYPLNPCRYTPIVRYLYFLAKTALRASFTVMQCGRLSKFDTPANIRRTLVLQVSIFPRCRLYFLLELMFFERVFLDNRRLSAFAFASAIHEVNFLSLVVPAPPETDLFVFLTCDFLFFIATSS